MEKNAKKRQEKQWRVGAYLRLSKEDETEGKSVSIDHQNAIIINCNCQVEIHQL